ncbi:hypothetical protein JY97_17610 [Alkalispirochaeta odontotermitis]|nr:hypothetical protein JY97_17610 [Alkalispirochaeta odontotermitis]
MLTKELPVLNPITKHPVLFGIISILAFGVPAITICSSYCIAMNFALDSPADGLCPLPFHEFFQIVLVISVLLALPFAGLFLFSGKHSIPSGIQLQLFKPPRTVH